MATPGRVAASSQARRRTAAAGSVSAERQVVVGQRPEPVERAEGGGPHRRPASDRADTRRARSPDVAGQGHRPPPFGDVFPEQVPWQASWRRSSAGPRSAGGSDDAGATTPPL